MTCSRGAKGFAWGKDVQVGQVEGCPWLLVMACLGVGLYKLGSKWVCQESMCVGCWCQALGKGGRLCSVRGSVGEHRAEACLAGHDRNRSSGRGWLAAEVRGQ